MIKELFSLSTALILLSSGARGNAIRTACGTEFKNVTGRVEIEVNGEPADLAKIEARSIEKTCPSAQVSVTNLGNGAYGIVFSHVPKATKHLAVTAQVPNPHRPEETLSQTLTVTISKGNNVEVPMCLFTN